METRDEKGNDIEGEDGVDVSEIKNFFISSKFPKNEFKCLNKGIQYYQSSYTVAYK